MNGAGYDGQTQFNAVAPASGMVGDEKDDDAMIDDNDESFNEHNKSLKSNSKYAKNNGKKSRRGRKRKNRDNLDCSTDSDSEIFNYDKFIKKVSKKGTRVHMNVRMYAIRSHVPGLKIAPVQITKLSITAKMNDNMDPKQDQKLGVNNSEVVPQSDPKPNVSQPVGDTTPMDEVSKNPDEASQALIDKMKKMEELYDPEGFDIGRYNLRRRASQKKYYDEDPDLDEELGLDPATNMAYNYHNFKGVCAQNYKPNSNLGRRNISNDAKFQNKTKRKKKKDDDEDYVEEYEDYNDDNEEYSPNSKQKFQKQQMQSQQQQNFNSQAAGQYGFMMGGMQQKMGDNFSMQNQFGMQNPMMQQNQMSKYTFYI